MKRTFHFFVLTAMLTILDLNRAVAANVPIVKSGQPMATLQIGALASAQEQFAAEEIQTFITVSRMLNSTSARIANGH